MWYVLIYRTSFDRFIFTISFLFKDFSRLRDNYDANKGWAYQKSKDYISIDNKST